MQIFKPPEKETFVKQLATSSGFASVGHYVLELIEREYERKAVPQAIADLDRGAVRSFTDFDRDFRAKHNSKPNAA